MALLRKLTIEILMEEIKQVFNGSYKDFGYLKKLNWVDFPAFPPTQKSVLENIQLEFRHMVPKEHEFDYRHKSFFFRKNRIFFRIFGFMESAGLIISLKVSFHSSLFVEGK